MDEEINLSRLVREILRNYLIFKEYSAQTGLYTIEHKGLTLSFIDLQHSLSALSERKREAIFYNVILDWKQKDVAERMGITTVSVGQYVDQGCNQLSKMYFPAEYEAKELENDRI